MAGGLWVAALPAYLWAHAQGPDPRYTAAPGDSPLSCASQTCHTSAVKGGPINTFGGSVSAVFSECDHYTPGQDQTITVTVSDPSNSVYGFQMTARLDSDQVNGQAGTFTPSGSDTFVMCDSGSPRGPRGCTTPTKVEFIEHSNPSRNSFTFKWTPPATDVGPVHFYLAGNAVNNNGESDGGDHVYTTSYTLPTSKPTVCFGTKPSIAAVVQASAFGQSQKFAAGSWLEIYGTNLSNGTREWGGCDFKGSAAPTSLDSISVSINGKDAAVRFISPGQVNVQAPDDSTTGPINVTLKACTQTSDPVQITKADLVPGLLATTVNNKQYLEAFSLDGTKIVGNPNNPSKPGDIIVAYGIGFGPTNPVVPAGTIAAGQTSVPGFSVLFGSAADPKPLYAGLGPGFVGLYQFDLTVPNLADGDYQMVFSVGGVQAQQSLLFTVKK